MVCRELKEQKRVSKIIQRSKLYEYFHSLICYSSRPKQRQKSMVLISVATYSNNSLHDSPINFTNRISIFVHSNGPMWTLIDSLHTQYKACKCLMYRIAEYIIYLNKRLWQEPIQCSKYYCVRCYRQYLFWDFGQDVVVYFSSTPFIRQKDIQFLKLCTNSCDPKIPQSHFWAKFCFSNYFMYVVDLGSRDKTAEY